MRERGKEKGKDSEGERDGEGEGGTGQARHCCRLISKKPVGKDEVARGMGEPAETADPRDGGELRQMKPSVLADKDGFAIS